MENRLSEFIADPARPDTFDAAGAGRAIAADGAVVVRRLIDAGTVAALKGALVNALAEDAARRGPTYLFKGMVHALMSRGQPFLDLLSNPLILAQCRAVLGHGCIVHAYNSSSMPPQLSNYSRSIHVDCPRLIPGYTTNLGLTIALDAFTPLNGAMEIAPGLRPMATAPDEQTFVANRLTLDHLAAGDCVVFDARCWHRGGVNQTAEWRHAVTLNVCRSYMRQQFDFPRLLGEEVWSQCPETARQFLGCFVRMPSSMDEFLLPADKRLYKPGQE